jgi:hypothetical protein
MLPKIRSDSKSRGNTEHTLINRTMLDKKKLKLTAKAAKKVKNNLRFAA